MNFSRDTLIKTARRLIVGLGIALQTHAEWPMSYLPAASGMGMTPSCCIMPK